MWLFLTLVHTSQNHISNVTGEQGGFGNKKQEQRLCWGLSPGSSGATREETVHNGNNHS